MQTTIAEHKKHLAQIASNLLAGSRFARVKFRLVENDWGTNMLGGETWPAASLGTVAHLDGELLVLKTSPNSFHGFVREELPDEPLLSIGDKVEIQFEGFDGTDKSVASSGEGCSTTTLGRKRLKSPVDEPEVSDMTGQLSEMRLADGRRGLHLLHDLNFSNFQGDGSRNYIANPYIQFDVDTSRFKGQVKIELILGLDYYTVHFISEDATESVENVDFTRMLPLICERCDDPTKRLARVTLIKKGKALKKAA